jgi:acyl-CoA reductase-like NAD-dependent aldehyde dehydrogenase
LKTKEMAKQKTGERKLRTNGKPQNESAGDKRSASLTESPALGVQKTYKLYIGGQFPRTESGRYYPVHGPSGALIANVCQGSRKDFREAVVAARKAFPGWSGKTAFNRSQILYRIAEMLEERKAQFAEELIRLGDKPEDAKAEVRASIDRTVYYAGWADKYQQVFSSVNPVSSSHFNFSMLEPMGVVSIFAPEESALLGFVSSILPVIAGGNCCIVLASESRPTPAISFAEVLNASDVPGGVVNILSGNPAELSGHFSTHMDVNALSYHQDDPGLLKVMRENGTFNVKRIVARKTADWFAAESQNPYTILDFQETKTTWHPVGV